MAVVLLPAIALWIGRPSAVAEHADARRRHPPHGPAPRALRSPAFWSVAAPFALALTAQVGFLVHQIAILEPRIGRAQAGFSVAALTVTAIIGRFGLGAVRAAPRHAAIHRLVAGKPGGGAAGDHAGDRHPPR